MRQFATGRPDAEDARQLRAFGQEIRRAIAQKALAPGLRLPGNVPYRDYGGVPFVPKAGKSCTRCGRCAAGCPVAAISAGDPASTDKALCISCMRCIGPRQHRQGSVYLLHALYRGVPGGGAQSKPRGAAGGRSKTQKSLPGAQIQRALSRLKL